MRSLWGTCKLEDEAAQASSLGYTDFEAQTGSKKKAIIKSQKDRRIERKSKPHGSKGRKRFQEIRKLQQGQLPKDGHSRQRMKSISGSSN